MKTTEIIERLTHLDLLSINRGGKVVRCPRGPEFKSKLYLVISSGNLFSIFIIKRSSSEVDFS